MATVPSSKFPFMARGDPTALSWAAHPGGRAKRARAGLATGSEVQSSVARISVQSEGRPRVMGSSLCLFRGDSPEERRKCTLREML